MTYLLDTDILSNLFRRSPSPSVLRRIALTPVDEQATSSINLGELYYGARRLAAGGDELVERINSTLLPNLRVFHFDLSAARVYGELRAGLERAGTPIGDADTRIAAIALAQDLTVVTANTRHFARVPALTVENWKE
ncbi:MAG: PIN domain-containing protein [Dehalococcoidia bacterium]|nr:PIN domain-containing protein [Dehalococcoidia bacterium]MCA9845669.1 PIN domain-containing protein [Dehalococcoidia bacterium]